MAIAGKITVDLEARDARWSDTISKSERELKRFVNSAQNSFKDLSFQNGAGGFANAFAGLTKGAAEYATSLRTGGDVQKEFSSAVEKIPIVGQFKAAGDAIRNLISGQKAARVETEKMVASARELQRIYRTINDERSKRGLYGDQRTEEEARQGAESKATDYGRQIEEDQDKINQVTEKGLGAWTRVASWLPGTGVESNGLTAAQNAEVARLEAHQKILRMGLKDAAGPGKDQALADVRLQIEQREFERRRSHEEEIAAFRAAQDERTLKLNGQIIESRKVAIEAGRDAQLRRNQDSIRPEALKLQGLNDAQVQARLQEAEENRIAIIAAADGSLKTAKEEESRRLEVAEMEHQSNLAKIINDGAADRLEAQGKHLQAELLKIQGTYDQEIAAAEKKNKEERLAENDPYIAQLKEEAAKKRDSAAEMARMKDADELEKKAMEASRKIEEDRKRLTEESLTPLEKYQEKLQEISKARDSGIIGDETFNKLLAKETETAMKAAEKPDHGIDPSSLYGRRLDFVIPGAADSSDTQKQLLELAKQRAIKDARNDDIFEYWRQNVLTNQAQTPTEMDIIGVAAA